MLEIVKRSQRITTTCQSWGNSNVETAVITLGQENHEVLITDLGKYDNNHSAATFANEHSETPLVLTSSLHSSI